MQKIRYIIQVLGLFALLTGCDDLIYDDLSDCPQGVNFQFYEQTPCQDSPSYPTAISQVRVFAFDSNNVLTEVYEAKDIVLTADYLLETPFYKVGTFTFVAWGGTDLDFYDFSSFEKNKTTKDQMFVSLQRQSAEFSGKTQPLYYGISSPLSIEDRAKEGTFYDLVTFNMQELTNRIRLTVHGLSETENYSVTITDDNGVYDFDANFAPDDRFDYISEVYREGKLLKVDFAIMKLAEGRNARLTIKNTRTGEIIYDVNLIEGLIMYKGENGEPPYSLLCDHDFYIDIKFGESPEPGDEETYMLLKIVVNDWNVVTRPVILE